tara:strand:- start:3712 stop:5340 length:1629 start_codon:yes stop_codon:yes gene_type:complete
MKEFRKYFSGLERDFGFCNVENGYLDPESGKLKFDPGDYGWSKRPITDQDYADHLSGKKAIGIQPCDDEAMASIGAIDVDPKNYKTFDLKRYLKIIEEKELPVIPIESKSGGLHIYVFTKEKVPATLIREFLQNLLFLFKLPSKTEIFPKQTKLGVNQNNEKTSGSFINLPYYKSIERVALKADGSKIELADFLNVVAANVQTKDSLEQLSKKKVREILTGGPEEFHDGPPCLQMICKEIQDSGKKLSDERDRFLYNYMVFAKKKFKETWEKKVLEAARNYIVYDEVWGDEKVKEKIKFWKKDTAGHQCHELPISAYCAKGTCLRRKFGIGSHKDTTWPQVSGLIKMDYKPDPEFFINVDLTDGKVVQIHAKHIKKIAEMKEMRALIAEQTSVFPPIIKNQEYQVILDQLWSNMETIKPPAGTNPIDMLKKYLEDYVNGPAARTYTSFKSGSVLEDEEFYYFDYDKFYEEIKRNEWNKDRPRTGTLIKVHFKGEFGFQKRFPKGESEKSYPPVRCLKIPIKDLKREEIPDEKVQIENKEDIV